MTDPFNNPTDDCPQVRALGYQDKMNSGEQDDTTTVSYTSLYDKGMQILSYRELVIEPDPGGNFALHHVYIEKEPGKYKGYNPGDYIYSARVEDSIDLRKLEEEFEGITQAGSAALTEFWSPLINPTVDKRKPIHAMAQHKIALAADRERKQNNYGDAISLAGNKGARHFVPQKEWFISQVHQVEAKDLLTLLPLAEQQMFLLLLGRIVVGRKNSYTVEGTLIDHTFRSAGILVGDEAGLGKSTLMDFVSQALVNCGYQVSTMQDTKSRFGWANRARSHFTYSDDLTQDSQQALISSSITKSLISNAMVATEKKGQDDVEVRSKTTLMACSNHWNPRDLHGADAGIISRFKPLYTYRQIELDCLELGGVSANSTDLRTKEHWKYLSEQLGVATETLGLWLLHLAANRFLEVCGYELDKKVSRYKQTQENRLHLEVERLTEQLRIQQYLDATQELLYFCRFVQCAKGCKDSYFQDQTLLEGLQVLARATESQDGANKGLGEVLEQHFEGVDRPKWHPYRVFRSLKLGSVPDALLYLKKALDLGHSKPDLIKTAMHYMVSEDGHKLVGSYSHIVKHWETAMLYDEHYEGIRLTPELKKAIGIASGDLPTKDGVDEAIENLKERFTEPIMPKQLVLLLNELGVEVPADKISGELRQKLATHGFIQDEKNTRYQGVANRWWRLT